MLPHNILGFWNMLPNKFNYPTSPTTPAPPSRVLNRNWIGPETFWHEGVPPAFITFSSIPEQP